MARYAKIEPVGVEPFAEHYAALKDGLPGAGLPWLAALREQGLARFAEAGLPTNKVEAWKYTTLRPLARVPFSPAAPEPVDIAKDDVPALIEDAYRLVFVNGRYRPELSDAGGLPRGVRLAGLAETLAADPGFVEAHLGKLSDFADQPMLALNTALMADGLVLAIEPGVSVERPIVAVFVGAGGADVPAWHPRNLVVVGRGARATLVEHHVGHGGGAYLANGATEVSLGDGAVLHHYKLQDETDGAYHLFFTRAKLGRDAVYDNFVLSAGGKLARNQIHAILDGRNVDCRLNGAYMGRNRQHLDHTSVIEHAQPHTRSRQVYKGVLDDQARGVFQGQIVVRPDAQKTDGYQLNRALLLSEGAEIDSKPMLEIYADDVKCSHGATAGDIDPNALFYLRARGIPEAEARGLLVEAFLAEALEEVMVETVREAFAGRVRQWLRR